MRNLHTVGKIYTNSRNTSSASLSFLKQHINTVLNIEPQVVTLNFFIALPIIVAVLLPIAFNPWGFNAFVLPKVLLLRGLVLVALTLALLNSFGKQQNLRTNLLNLPLLWPTLAFGLTLILATLFSVNQSVSIWGAFDRQQGVITHLSYLVLFLLTATGIKKRIHIQWIWNAIIWGSVPALIYGLAQSLNLDFFQWASDTASPVISTLGRSNFFGSYLVLVIPLTLGRLLTSRQKWLYGTLLAGQIVCLGLTQARGAWLGLGTAMVTILIILAIVHKNRRLLLTGLLLAALAVAFVVLLNTPNIFLAPEKSLPGLDRLSQLTDTHSGSTAARVTIWQTTLPLIVQKPWLGYGPDTMRLVFDTVFPPQLVYYQGRHLAVDRAHNLWLDLVMTGGIIAVATFGWILVGFGRLAWRALARRNSDTPILWAALIGAIIGHLVDMQFGFNTIASAAIFWLVLALGVGLSKIENGSLPPQHLPYQKLRFAALPPTIVLLAVIGLVCVRPFLADAAYWKSQSNQILPAAQRASAAQAVKLWPLEPEYRYGLALRQAEAGNFAAVESEFVTTTRLHPNDARLWAKWGQLYARWGEVNPQQFRQAETAYRQALTLAPNIAAYHTALGLILAQQNKLPAGIAELERAVDLDTTDVAAYDHLANLYALTGEDNKAAQAKEQGTYWAEKTTNK